MSTKQIIPPFETFFDSNGLALENGKIYIGENGLDPEANPQTAYFDSALTSPAAQPIRTINGYISDSGTAAQLFVANNYSITVRDKNDVLIYTKLTNEDDTNPLYFLSDYSTLSSALTAISTDDVTLVIDSPFTVAESVIIPSNVALLFYKSGYLSVSSTFTLTLTDNSITADVDNFIFQGAGTVDGTIANDFIRPEWFGAVGDGVTDDTANIQKSINFLYSGSTLRFGTGKTYKIDISNANNPGFGDVSTYVLLVANLNNISVIGDNSKILNTESTTTNVSLGFGNCDNVTLSGIEFDGQFDFTGITTYNYNQLGVIFDQCKQVKVLNNRFLNISNTALAISNDYDSTPDLLAIENVGLVEGNYFENYGQNTTFGGFSQLIITNNHFKNPHLTIFKMSSRGTGASIEDSFLDVIIDSNILYFTSDYELDADPSVTSVIGWDCVSNVKNYKINNNILDFKNCPKVSQGIKVEWASTPATTDVNLNNINVHITNNQLLNMDVANSQSILLNNTIKFLKVQGNIFNTGDDGIIIGVIALQNTKPTKTFYSFTDNDFIDLSGADISISNSDIDFIEVKGNSSALIDISAANQFFNMESTSQCNILSIKNNFSGKPIRLRGDYNRASIKDNDIEIIPTTSTTIDAISSIMTATVTNSQIACNDNSIRYGKNGIYIENADYCTVKNNVFSDLTAGYRINAHNKGRFYTNTFINCTNDYTFDNTSSDDFGMEIIKSATSPTGNTTPNFQGETIIDISDAPPSNYAVATGLGSSDWAQVGAQFRTGTGTPVSSVTPRFQGELFLNTTPDDWYISTGLTNTDWKQIT